MILIAETTEGQVLNASVLQHDPNLNQSWLLLSFLKCLEHPSADLPASHPVLSLVPSEISHFSPETVFHNFLKYCGIPTVCEALTNASFATEALLWDFMEVLIHNLHFPNYTEEGLISASIALLKSL